MKSMRFKPEEVAAIAGVTKATVMRYIRRKKLKAKRTRCYAIEAEAVLEFLISQAANRKAHNRKTVNS